MWEVRYRHEQLYDAVQSKNTEYALYQLKKIILAMKKGAERRPNRKASYDWFFKNSEPAMKKAIASKTNTLNAFKKFTQGCITCHSMEKVPYMPVRKFC